MFKSIKGNKKIIGLVVVTIILVMSSFKKSFKPTLDSYEQKKELTAKLNYTQGALSRIDNLRSEVTILNNKLGTIDVKPQEVQQQLLTFVNKIPKIEVVEVNKIHEARNSICKIYTHQIVIDGTFQELLEALYTFEKEFISSRIVSFSFESIKKNGKVLKNQRLNITFQNYEKFK